MPDTEDKRGFLRLPIDCKLSYSVVGGNHQFEGKVINLSSTGILFASSEAIEVGNLITLVITTSQTNTPPMHATVKVERVTNNQGHYEIACTIRKKPINVSV